MGSLQKLALGKAYMLSLATKLESQSDVSYEPSYVVTCKSYIELIFSQLQ